MQTVSVDGCSGDTCIIHKGKPVVADVKFNVNADSSRVQLTLIAQIDNTNVTVPDYDQNGCDHLKCPLVKASVAELNYSFTVPAALPDVSALLFATLTNENSDLLACIKVKAQVQ